MPAPRRFDHDEARRRHAAGERIVDLARSYGVTVNAIDRVVHDRSEVVYAGQRRRRTGICENCGGPAMRLVGGKEAHNPDGLMLCQRCRGIRSRVNVRFNSAGVVTAVRCVNRDCANGERWQPPENFPRGKRFRDLREGGFHSACRQCGTRGRRDYRARHREADNAYSREYQRKRRAKATA